MMSLTCLQKVIEVTMIVWTNHNLKVLKLLWKWCRKMIFAHCFDHNFWSTKNFLVWFIALEIRHLGLLFEYNFCLIWTSIKWVTTVSSWVIRAMRMHETSCLRRHKPAYAYKNLRMQGSFQNLRSLVFRAQSLPLWWGLTPRPFGTSKTLK